MDYVFFMNLCHLHMYFLCCETMCLFDLYGMGYGCSEVVMGSCWCCCGVCFHEFMVD